MRARNCPFPIFIPERLAQLGPIPACYIVLAGYAIILLSTVFRGKLKSGRIFYLGWVPVFGLAALGVTSELMGNHICPPSAGGVPQCFYSLAMITICLVLIIATSGSERNQARFNYSLRNPYYGRCLQTFHIKTLNCGLFFPLPQSH